MGDPLVDALALEVSYARIRLAEARVAYRRRPLDPRTNHRLDDAEASLDVWLERLEKAEASEEVGPP